MAKRKLAFQPGDWFGVPLPGGGFAVGMLARMDGKGLALGYFFGPRRARLPTVEELRQLERGSAVETQIFGDLGLRRGTWPVIGRQPNWCPEDWPVPAFGRIDDLGHKAWRAGYDDHDLRHVSDVPIDVSTARTFPQDGLMGFAGMENWLSHILPEAMEAGGAGTTEPDAVTGEPSGGLTARAATTSLGDNVVAETWDDLYDDDDDQQMVQVFIPLPAGGMGAADWDRLEELEDLLQERLDAKQVGELDGNEIGAGFWCIYLCGPDAEALAATVFTLLHTQQMPPGSYLVKRCGSAGEASQHIDL